MNGEAAESTSANNGNATTETKVRELLEQMTLKEKIDVMTGSPPFWAGMASMMGGGYASQTWNAGEIERLGIPGIRFSDGPRGVVMDGGTTFPVSMARGATWDTELEERVGDIIGRELKVHGANLFGGVCINLLRHPAWGRAQESYGEDPFHLGEFGAALARGVQHHTMACVKHYALNSMENARFKINAKIRPRALHEIYLPHFKRVVDEGVACVMSAYNQVNGEWCGENKELLTNILKRRWGFQGFVITDFILGMRDAKRAALAGQDIEMPFRLYFDRDLEGLVERGEVPEERIDDAVLRILGQQFRFAAPRADEAAKQTVLGCDAHRAVAREAAQKSIVLLKNEGAALPLAGIAKLAVIGRLADTPNTGDGGSSNTRPAHVVTPLEGLRAALGDGVRILHNDGANLDQARSVAEEADAAIVVVGYTHEDEGEYISVGPDGMGAALPAPKTDEERAVAQDMMQAMGGSEAGSFSVGGDRASLRLRPDDEALIQAVAAGNDRTIVAVMAGSAVIMESWREKAAAILMLWYPGMEGGHALADVVFGNVNPSGKLPMVFPKSPDDLPYFDRDATEIEYDLWHGYRKLDRDGHAPAFPFGFGLSYTTFEYQDLQIERTEFSPDGVVRASVAVTNTGDRPGDEVVQFYVSVRNSCVERAPKELKAFARVALAPGETRRVPCEIPVSRLAYFDEAQSDFVVEKTEYELIAGTHSLDPKSQRVRFRVS